MKRVKSILNYLLPSMTAVISFFLCMNDHILKYYDFASYEDDFYTLGVFSWIVLLIRICNFTFLKSNLITSLCSYWMFISSIHHWLTEDEWTAEVVLISLVNIIAMLYFTITYTLIQYKGIDKLCKLFYIVTTVFLFISASLYISIGYIAASVTCVICILLITSEIMRTEESFREVDYHEFKKLFYEEDD